MFAAMLHLMVTFPKASSQKTFNLYAVSINRWQRQITIVVSKPMEKKLNFTFTFQTCLGLISLYVHFEGMVSMTATSVQLSVQPDPNPAL
jgi:hypothetical protein